ncbi:MAG TPA: ABC transporter substrate-binding protein [Gemmatimonadaceae bacterium]|nr:ABC transporter substrate-binding protein [Gemmatimonadaceae bacterium]
MSNHRARLFGLSGKLTVALLLATIGSACDAGSRGGSDTARAGATGDTAAGAKPTIAIIRAADWIGSEWSEDAIKVGLLEEDLERGRDYEFRNSSAQGDLATLPSLIDAAIDSKARVIVTLQDATLQAALQRVRNNTPIVFHVLADPFAAGAGTTDSNHLANVTGVYSPGFGDPEQERRIALIKRVVPSARRVGILFSPNEPLAVQLKDRMTQAGQRNGLEIVSVPVNSMNDAGDATNTLIGRRVEAIEIFGNTAHAAFPVIIRVARERKVPVFSPSPFEMLQGAVAAVYPDFQEGGIVAGRMIGRVLKGESPANIPFHQVRTIKTDVSTENARAAGVTLSPEAQKAAGTSTPETKRP